jgi:LPXTG-motif cell wall-anchored protein
VTCYISDVATQDSFYVNWISNLQNSYIVEWAPTTNQGSIYKSTSDTTRNKYLGLGNLGVTYLVTVTVFINDDYTGERASASAYYTVPLGSVSPIVTPPVTPLPETTPTVTPPVIPPVTPTETGGELPDTASNESNLLLLGGVLIFLGGTLLLFRRLISQRS